MHTGAMYLNGAGGRGYILWSGMSIHNLYIHNKFRAKMALSRLLKGVFYNEIYNFCAKRVIRC